MNFSVVKVYKHEKYELCENDLKFDIIKIGVQFEWVFHILKLFIYCCC